MYIADNIIRDRLKKVYFIWGRGKTTVSDRLRDKFGFYVYRTDDSRDYHRKDASPIYQPYMCYDFEKEYAASKGYRREGKAFPCRSDAHVRC